MNSPRIEIADRELHAWVDGRLQGDDRTRVAAAVAADPALAAQADHLRRQNAALRALFDAELELPVPARLVDAARAGAGATGGGEATRASGVDPDPQGLAARPDLRNPAAHRLPRPGAGPANRPWFRQAAGLAGAAALGVAIGWLARGAAPEARVEYGAPHSAPGARPAAVAALDDGIPRAAAVAYAAYAPEIRHPVEVGANEQDHLVAWLSKRLGTPLKVPNLGESGFALVGGRLLPDDRGGVAAQFMFESAAGERLTLFVRRDAAGTDTAFRFAEQADIGTFYWLDRGFGYALSGKLPRDAMLSVATNVYRQLNP